MNKPINNNLNSESFKFVNIQAHESQAEQVFGKYSSTIVNITKRFLKKPLPVLALLVFVIIVLLTIIVPAISGDAYKTPIANFVYANNLRPLIPALGLNGSYQITMTSAQLIHAQSLTKGFVIASQLQDGGIYLVTINPYVLPEIQAVLPAFNLGFGTDESGISLWAKTWYGAARSMQLAATVSIAALLIGITYGAIAAWFAGKWIDTLMMRFVEIFSSIPSIVLILAIAFYFVGTGKTVDDNSLLPTLILLFWTSPASLTRIYVLRLKDRDYVTAARSMGGSIYRILAFHILPNIAGRLMVQFVLSMPAIIFYQATLVFLGVSDPGLATLGSLVSNGSRVVLTTPYLMWVPVGITFFYMFSIWFLAMGLNDAIDPQNKRGIN